MRTVPPDTRQRYLDVGYVILPELLDSDEVLHLRTTCDHLLIEPPDDDKGGKAHDIGRGEDRRFLRHRHADLPHLAEFVLGESMKNFVTPFLGGPPFPFNEQFIVKGPKTGASFAWHQDSGYVMFEHTPYVTVWLALDDTTVDNGAVYVLPRNLNEDTSVVTHHWDQDGKVLIGYEGTDPGVPAFVPAGSAVVFSSVTLHRSSPNITDQPRRAFIAQYSSVPIIDPETGQPKIFATAL